MAREAVMDEDTWKVVQITAGIANANIISGRLEVDGIPSRLKYEAAGRIYAITIDGLGEVEVLVPAEKLQLAREVLNRYYHEDDLDWKDANSDPDDSP